MKGSEFYLDTLKQIVSQPTAPFHEERIAKKITGYLQQWQIPYQLDEFGNILAHYQHGSGGRPLVLMAHMDHPAFTVVSTNAENGADLVARLEGGVSSAHFDQPLAVKLFPSSRAENEPGLPATITSYTVGARPRDINFYVKLANPADIQYIQPDDFGIWDLTDFEILDGFIHARVLDDLVGCASALLTLWQMAQEQAETDVYAVFTRAEEVGLVGADAVMTSGVLPKDAYIVSLEASKTLPGAVQGEGPVIRVGDKVFTFNEEAELILKAAAERLGSNIWHSNLPNKVKVQRQLMSGGSCEAGAALLTGYSATGLAFPLGNYHNMTSEFKLAPENISEADYLTGIALLQEAARLMPEIAKIQAAHAQAYTTADALLQRLKDTRDRINSVTNNTH